MNALPSRVREWQSSDDQASATVIELTTSDDLAISISLSDSRPGLGDSGRCEGLHPLRPFVFAVEQSAASVQVVPAGGCVDAASEPGEAVGCVGAAVL
jgi:hypothetical protein